MNAETLVPVGGRMTFQPSDILFFESEENYTRLHLKDGRVLLTATNIGKLESRFLSHNFFRPNRSRLINLAFMIGFEKETNSIRMANNETMVVSRRRIKKFMNMSEVPF